MPACTGVTRLRRTRKMMTGPIGSEEDNTTCDVMPVHFDRERGSKEISSSISHTLKDDMNRIYSWLTNDHSCRINDHRGHRCDTRVFFLLYQALTSNVVINLV